MAVFKDGEVVAVQAADGLVVGAHDDINGNKVGRDGDVRGSCRR
jgi:hypothetical protein